jgi:putative nucleotidyltransferase with HDIG domain
MESSVSLEKIVTLTGDLPPMPNVAAKVMEMMSNPVMDGKSMQKVIATDQALASKILKIANSALYSFSKEIASLGHAISIIGFNTITSLVIASSTKNAFFKGKMGLQDAMIWEHSLASAFGCRALAKKVMGAGKMEVAFLSGLLHDIGKIVLSKKIPDQYSAIVQEAFNTKTPIYELEQKNFGFTHSDVGSLIAKQWKLPAVIEECIHFHHEPESAKTSKATVEIVDALNKICSKIGCSLVSDKDLELMEIPIIQKFFDNDDALKLFIQELVSTVGEQKSLFA